MNFKNFILRAITGLCIAVSMLGIFYFLPACVFTLTLIAIFIGIGYEWNKIHPHASIISWIVYPILPSIIILIANSIERFHYLVGLLFILVFVHDTSAYIIGSVYGTHKFVPSISPGKTWEGLIGGLVGVAIALYFVGMSVPMISAGSIGITLLATAGDVYVSWYKRKAGVKDTGSLLPGHGGILDRCDSLLFCAYGLGIILLVALAIRS